jgi:hypothetical protein
MSARSPSGPVQVGRPGDGVSSEEIAAVLAALTRREDPHDAGTGYDRWRDVRLAALRARPRRG